MKKTEAGNRVSELGFGGMNGMDGMKEKIVITLMFCLFLRKLFRRG